LNRGLLAVELKNDFIGRLKPKTKKLFEKQYEKVYNLYEVLHAIEENKQLSHISSNKKVLKFDDVVVLPIFDAMEVKLPPDIYERRNQPIN